MFDERIQSYKPSLEQHLRDILERNPALAISLMGVGIGTDRKSGGKQFEVRVSREVDELTGTLLPTIFAGFAVSYEKAPRGEAEKPAEE